MDAVDYFVIFAAVMAILNIVVQMGSECAARVWQRTTETLDEVDFLEGNTIPYTTNEESLLITAAALLKRLFLLPLTLYRAYAHQLWSLTPEERLSRLRLELRSDILLAVSSMLSGYPERATLLYLDTLREQLDATEAGSPLQPN